MSSSEGYAYDDRILRRLDELSGQLRRFERRTEHNLGVLMATSDDIAAAVTAFGGLLSDMDTEVSALGTDVTAIQSWIAAHPDVDTSALNDLVASVAQRQSNLDTAVASANNVLPSTPPAGS
jgi:ABC-type transporter Mla subunit MlaD